MVLSKSGHPSFMSLPYFFLALGLAIPAFADWQSVGGLTPQSPQGQQVLFSSRRALVAVTALAPDLVRIRMTPGTRFGPDSSWAIVKTDWPRVAVDFSGDKQTRVMRTPELEIRVQLDPFRVAFYDLKGELISRDARAMAWDERQVRCWKWMPPDEHYYGLGEKAGPLDKRGHTYVMWNTDPAGYDANTDPLYQSVPFFIGLRKGKAYGIFFDNTYRSSFDMGAESPDYYSFGAEGGEMNYYFIYGPDPKKVITRFTELVGLTALPPRWSLGYIQSSAHYFPESTVRFVADNFRHRHIPCDAIFIDNVHMEANRIFTWNKSDFPDPPRMLTELRQRGFHIFAIVDPGVKVDQNYYVYQQGIAGEYFLKRKNGKVYTGEIWPGESAFPDFTSEKARAWWGSLAGGFAKAGLSGYLTDMNEPTVDDLPLAQGWVPRALDPDVVHYDHGLNSPDAKNHNVYGMLMSAATRDGLLRSQPNERPFVITRATYAGGQRYAAQWTGDNLATWEDLRASLRVVMSMGLSGMPFTGSDIGGFVGYPSPELYTRWLQAGVFHPFFWTHTGGSDRTLDPWSFGTQLEEINRRSIELRYRLLPYLYNAFYEATQTGLPIMRPLLLDYPDDATAMDSAPANQNNEFLWGNDFLVAPVVTAGEEQRKVYFPKGTWYDFWTDQPYSGPLTTAVEAPIDRIPIFVRAGAIIPMQQVVEYVDQAPLNPLTLEIYPEGNSTRPYYEDDGISFACQRGGFLLRRFSVSQQGGAVRVQISAREGHYTPPARSLVLKVHGQPCLPRLVQVGGKTLEIQASPETLNRATEGAAYDAAGRIVWIKAPDQSVALEARIQQ